MPAKQNWIWTVARMTLLTIFTCALVAGCERKERVVDVRTPAGDVTVDRNIDSGEVEVDVNER